MKKYVMIFITIGTTFLRLQGSEVLANCTCDSGLLMYCYGDRCDTKEGCLWYSTQCTWTETEDKKDDEKAKEEDKCNGVKLNTNVPFIGNCIEFASSKNAGPEVAGSDTTKVTHINAFPKLMGALMNILTIGLLIIGFLMIVIGGVMMTMGGLKMDNSDNFSTGKKMIMKVWTVLALLGLSGVILKLINPTFFT